MGAKSRRHRTRASKTSKKNNIVATIKMEHVTEHPSRAKRRKLDEGSQESSEATIKNPSQLRNLLVFQQNPPAAKQGKFFAQRPTATEANDNEKGLLKFKEFLNSIHNPEKASEKAQKLQVLKGYCDKQISPGKEKEEDSICFPDLIQTWGLGDSGNHDSLLTNVPSVLAVFLKTISRELEFREFGLALCKHLLQKDQLRLFNRGLTATKSKEHLISPCLRLLRRSLHTMEVPWPGNSTTVAISPSSVSRSF
jgi:Ribosome 60S biogenesis N-terminal.